MTKTKNKIITGDYKKKKVDSNGMARIFKTTNLNNKNVKAYEMITDKHQKSSNSRVTRNIVSSTLLGPVGMLAGELSAKSKGIYQFAIQFKYGEKNLLEVDNKLYKAIIKVCL